MKINDIFITLKPLLKGSIIANLITILMSPIITRIYAPSDFGFYTLLITSITLFGPIINLKYEMAIVKSQDNKEEINLTFLSMSIGFILSVIISVFYSIFVIYSHQSNYIIVFVIIFLILQLTSLNNIFMSINNKYSEYNVISYVSIIRAVSNNILSLIFGLLKFTNYGLVISQIISLINGIYKQSTRFRREIKNISKINLNNMYKELINHKNMALFSTPAALLTTGIYSSIIIFITYEYTTRELGYYSLGFRILGIPFTIISANVARVYYEKASKEFIQKGQFQSVFVNFLKLLLITVVPMIIIIAIAAPYTFGFIFGEKWKEAGFYITLLSPMFCVRLIADSFLTTFIIKNRQKTELIFHVLLLILIMIIYLITHLLGLNITEFLFLISIIYSIFYSVILYIMYQFSKVEGIK
ncbi:hypothetical protein BHU61_10025 [Macrococcus epidermidis]|uniref:Polysaccharide biosynthesis protein n=1 Tax=Macrococcus epidermidis TaxID=1902580 RepID=A0A327ZRD1_9STAP|nr:oligosaccharide flippase family protein [Macrococcus epidermidis]RAK44104.1 hypothetical protein BHU61_10025 [Macrococcus epidermidis]